jgi:hypothetical protein
MIPRAGLHAPGGWRPRPPPGDAHGFDAPVRIARASRTHHALGAWAEHALAAVAAVAAVAALAVRGLRRCALDAATGIESAGPARGCGRLRPAGAPMVGEG